MDELRERVDDAFQSITPEMRANAVNNYVKRLKKCVKNGGGHIEVVIEGELGEHEAGSDDDTEPEISDEEMEVDEESDEEEEEDEDEEEE